MKKTPLRSSSELQWRCRHLFVASLAVLTLSGPAQNIDSLSILHSGYPRAFFFRQSELLPARNERLDYETWSASFSRLMGIEGKVLDEESPGRSGRTAEF